MGRPRKNLGQSSSKVIEENILLEEPEGIDSSVKIVPMREVPEYRRVIFHNGRDPGQPLDFHYASATHPLKLYTLLHDKPVTLPVEVIEHLESCASNNYAYGFNPELEKQSSYVKSRNHYFTFRNVPAGK